MASERYGGMQADTNDSPSAGNEVLNVEYQELSAKLLVLETQRTSILLQHCEDERGLDGIEEEIRKNIRDRARQENLGIWEVNRQLVVIEEEIEDIKQKIYDLQAPIASRIKNETETIDFSR